MCKTATESSKTEIEVRFAELKTAYNVLKREWLDNSEAKLITLQLFTPVGELQPTVAMMFYYGKLLGIEPLNVVLWISAEQLRSCKSWNALLATLTFEARDATTEALFAKLEYTP